MGVKLNIGNEVKPLLDRTVNEQVASLQAKVRNDPFLEVAARREWAKMCRSISLGATAQGMPNLWLELRPTRAFAAQPRISESAVTLTVGVQADTRIVPNETKPDCPFPAQLDIVAQMEKGRVNLAIPIDIPFTEVNRLMEKELKGKTFPEDKSGAFTATVRSVNLAASGDRLLISVGLRANETKTWFGFGGDGDGGHIREFEFAAGSAARGGFPACPECWRWLPGHGPSGRLEPRCKPPDRVRSPESVSHFRPVHVPQCR
jgi:hypothetical protein